VGTAACVQCIAPDRIAACAGMTPICGDDRTCRAFSSNDQCASSVCLPDGSCGDEVQVAYVAPGGGGATCMRSSPCATLAAALAAKRPTVKIGVGLVKDNATTTIDGRRVVIVADAGAKLDRDGNGVLLEIRSANADVQIFDLEITGQTGAPGDGVIAVVGNGGSPKLALTRVRLVDNQGVGLSSLGGAITIDDSTISGNSDGVSFAGGTVTIVGSTVSANANTGVVAGNGTLTIRRSTLAQNAISGVSINGGAMTLEKSTIAKNGRISVNVTAAEFDITNNYVVDNGSAAATFGGILINQANTGTRRLEFNTISGNTGTSSTSGVLCQALSPTVTFSNNIVFGNVGGGGSAQVSTTGCSWSFSNIGPQAERHRQHQRRPSVRRAGCGRSSPETHLPLQGRC
jgi:hypothetical protein